MASMFPYEHVPLAELGEFRNGVNFGKGLKGSGLGLINVKDIFTDSPRLDFSSLDLVDLAATRGINHYFVEKGDLFFVRSSVKRDGIGYVAHSDRRTHEAVHCGFVIRFRPINERVDYQFLTYALRSPECRERIRNLSSGAAITNISQEVLGRLLIKLPPLPIQRRIATILSTYDELIENSQQRIKILESMARNLYREWFVHFRFPGHESVPSVSSTLGDIRQGCEVMKLGDLCELRKDQYRDSEHSELPLVDMARMPSRSLAPSNTGTPDELATSRILFESGDTLFGAIRCYLHKVVTVHYPGVTNTSVLVLRPKAEYFRALLAVIASDIDTIRWAEKQSTGTKMPVINWGVFQGMPTPIPSKTLAQSFEDIAGPMLDEIGVLATKIKNLRRTRDLLLPRLLSGQIN